MIGYKRNLISETHMVEKQAVYNLNSRSKVRWACRRGMLELDVLLLPFMDEGRYDNLDEAQQLVFQRLLSCDDPDLFAWFMGHQNCDDLEFKQMIGLILNRVPR